MKQRISRLVSILMALCMVAALLPGTALAADITYPATGGNLYFDPETGTVFECDKSVTAAVIPRTINGVPVTTIGFEAFSGCGNLTSVTIPDSVTDIGVSAFYGCERLEKVTIPNSVTHIWDHAFAFCSKLTSVNIPAGVTDIGEGAFAGCSLTGITVAKGNPAYVSVDGVLFNAGQKTLYTYPMKKSGAYNIPTSVTRISDWAFYNCRGLTGVTIPSSVTYIGDLAFDSCSSLTSVTIPSSVTSIGMQAFSSCSSLTSVNIPNGVTTIKEATFYGCSSLTSVTIPSSVTTIGGAFAECSSLRDVYYGGSKSQWNRISIDNFWSANDALYKAKIHYNTNIPSPVSVTVKNKSVIWTDAEPYIDTNKRTMVPLRAVGEALGLTVDWDANKKEAIFKKGTKTIYFPIGKTTARTGDGKSIQMDTAAVIINGRTYAPIRYLAEYFGYTVDWNAGTRTVLIN